ncbi:hypothetical protein Tco_0444940 [Tanacetum coccineum]
MINCCLITQNAARAMLRCEEDVIGLTPSLAVLESMCVEELSAVSLVWLQRWCVGESTALEVGMKSRESEPREARKPDLHQLHILLQ